MKMREIGKRLAAAAMILAMSAGLAACGAQTESEPETANTEEQETDQEEKTKEPVEIQVFIAASLNTVMTDLAAQYNEEHPEVKITFNADSSGTLLTQIEEGYECDIFFSAAQKQMDQLEADGFVVDGTRKNVVNNQVVVVTLKDSGTEVTGLETLNKAKSIALAGGSVPVGKYTRQALVNLGILNKVDDVSAITTEEIIQALGGVEISEQANVSKVLIAVAEGACEVGTTYYSDTYGYEDKYVFINDPASTLERRTHAKWSLFTKEALCYWVITVPNDIKRNGIKPERKSSMIEMYVSSSTLKVRSGAGSLKKQVDTLKKNEKVEIIASKGDWVMIGQDRWVNSKYLSKQQQLNIKYKALMEMNVRDGYTTKGTKIIGKVKKNAIFTVSKIRGKWGYSKEYKGWICLQGETKTYCEEIK